MTKHVEPSGSFAFLPVQTVVEALQSAIGSRYDAVPLSDIVRDSSPPHIVAGELYLLHHGNEKMVAKLGQVAALEKERKTLTDIAALGHDISSGNGLAVVLPEPKDPIYLEEIGVSALLYPFLGTRTLESYRAAGDLLSIKRTLGSVLQALARAAILWPGAMPRNLVLSETNERPVVVYPVDWEMGFFRAAHAGSSEAFLVRCLELHEEMSAVARRTLPYWSREWPLPTEFARTPARHKIVTTVHIAKHRDPRIAALGRLLETGEYVSDTAYFRIIELLCAFCERQPSIGSLLYSADHVSKWGEMDLRLRGTLLAWFLEAHGRPQERWNLARTFLQLGIRLNVLWRCSSDTELDRVLKPSLCEARNVVEKIGRAGTGLQDWWSKVITACQEFVERGTPQQSAEYEVLFWV